MYCCNLAIPWTQVYILHLDVTWTPTSCVCYYQSTQDSEMVCSPVRYNPECAADSTANVLMPYTIVFDILSHAIETLLVKCRYLDHCCGRIGLDSL